MDVKRGTMQESLEKLINHLNEEVISVFHNIKPTFLPISSTAEVEFLLIVKGLK